MRTTVKSCQSVKVTNRSFNTTVGECRKVKLNPAQSGSGGTPTIDNVRLLETSDYRLLETGDYRLLE